MGDQLANSQMVERIVRALPDLRRDAEWRVFAYANDIALLVIPGTGSAGGNPSYQFEQSEVAIVSSHRDGIRLLHREAFDPATRQGFLNVSTSHAILSRHFEYDDMVGRRYGFDDVYVIDYFAGTSRRFAPYDFQEGSYMAGHILVAVNGVRNWMAVLRDERQGFGDNKRLITYVFDLVSGEEVVQSPLLSVATARQLDMPGAASHLVVLDHELKDHVFFVNETEHELQKHEYSFQAHKWQVAIPFASEDRAVARQIAERLKTERVRVFFDEDLDIRGASIGEDLPSFLRSAYGDDSQYGLVIVSQHYLRKRWPQEEYKAIRDAIRPDGTKRVIPVTVDGTVLPDQPDTVFFDLRTSSVDQLIPIVLQKIGRGAEPS